MRTCQVCGVDISGLHRNTKMCKRCSIIKNGSLEDLIAFDPSVLETMKEGLTIFPVPSVVSGDGRFKCIFVTIIT